MQRSLITLLSLVILIAVARGADTYNLPSKEADAGPATAPANPMEELATTDAVHRALGDNPPAIILFAESRELPVRRFDGLPAVWLSRASDQRSTLTARAQPGECFVFQIAVFAPSKNTGELSATGTGFPGAVDCISLGGVGNDGKPLQKNVTVEAGHVVPLWFAAHIPPGATGNFRGIVTMNDGHGFSAEASVNLNIAGDPLNDGGISDPARLARLSWLNSTVGSEARVTKPFMPITVQGNTISILGRDVQFGDDGLPAQLTSHFSGSNTKLLPQGRDVLAGPCQFAVEMANGPAAWKSTPVFRQASDASVDWMTRNTSGDLDCDVAGHMEFDGMLALDLQLTAKHNVDCKDIHFQLPMHTDIAKYLMGLGNKGGKRPAEVHWKWDADKFQDAVWMGDVNAGVMCRFKGENYRRPLVNIYYPFSPLRIPESWGGGEASGIEVVPEGNDRVVLRAFTGPYRLQAGQTLHFKLDLFLTPFKLLNTDQHWADRFVHPFEGSGQKVVDHVLSELNPAGPNIVEIHHATYTNPYINYPYNSDSLGALEKFTAQVHDLKSRLMVYYTTRELTTNLPELWALKSLNGEVIFPGPGADAKTVVNPKGPDPWLTDHLRDSFIPAWRAQIGSPYNKPDLAVITTPDSRWNNFYLEGLKYLCEKVKIDGVYIDDTALDHRSMQRARRILDTNPNSVGPRLIDVHSWNHNNAKAHYSNSAIVYMELFPYVDRLWLGEGFDCNKVSPDYWLIEMSGIPYGLNAEMLQGGGNPGLGMLYGETSKLGWTQGDPRPMWKRWDAFGMTGSEMLGYWDPACPVHTDSADVLATVYKKDKGMMIVLGNFSDKPRSFHLKIDGGGPAKLTAPSIEKMQEAGEYSSADELKLDPKRGLILLTN